MYETLESIKESIENAANSIYDHFKSLVSVVEDFVERNGGISGILNIVGSHIHQALNIVTQLAAVFNVPVSDIDLLTKAYTAVQQLDAVVKILQGEHHAA